MKIGTRIKDIIASYKHLQGQHNQKKHGWRHSTVSGIKRTLQRESQYEKTEYATAHRARAGMSREDALHATISRVERKIRNLSKEKFVVFGSDGKILFEKGGEESYVSFSDDELDKIVQLAEKDNIIFTHNHPSSLRGARGTAETMGRSFSQDDILFAARHNFSEMRAVAADGSVYIMKRPRDGWKTMSIDTMGEVLRKADKTVYTRLSSEISNKELSIQEANGRHSDYVVKEFLFMLFGNGLLASSIPVYLKEELPLAYQRR